MFIPKSQIDLILDFYNFFCNSKILKMLCQGINKTCFALVT